MINRKMLNNVLKRVTSAEDTSEETPEDTSSQQQLNKPVQRWRYYFYNAPPESSIKFSYLSSILVDDTPERSSLINKLRGGNTGKYYADYFRWKKIVIATTQYSSDGKTLVVYEADLNPMGTKVVGSERVYPTDSPVRPENFEADLLLYTDKRSNSSVINIDQSSESLFSDQDPPNNLSSILINRTRPSGRFVGYNNFIKLFDEYRIWATNLNQLLLPSFDLPMNDDVPGGHYVGGQEAFNRLVGPVLKKEEEREQEKPKGPSLGEEIKEEETEEKGPFEAVDEQRKDKIKGDYLDKGPIIKMGNLNRRLLWSVVATYIDNRYNCEKESDYSMSTSVNNSSTSEDNSSLSKQIEQEAKKHGVMEKELKNIAKKIDQISS
jgi:hypothetical protein